MPQSHNHDKASETTETLHALLGGFKPCRFLPTGPAVMTGLQGMRIEEIMLQSNSGESIRAILTGPEGEWQALPAVLYCHAHGNRYEIGANELIDGRPALLCGPYGPALAKAGFIALSIDMPCFGLRQHFSETALSKKLLYRGQTLFGHMLSELGGALAFLGSYPGVDPSRMGVFGFSMGATQAFWLGALESRLRAIAHSCSFADLATLVDSGAHDLHGIYMTVPGLLGKFRTGEIAGLSAPHPQLVQLGLQDPLTPEAAVKTALEDLKAAYRSANAEYKLEVHLNAETGHIETELMRENALAFFRRWL